MFDVLPMYGHLQPGAKQQVTFSFYGHENISREVVAQCHVDEGPTYEVRLRGEASTISYNLDSTFLNFGLQVRIQSLILSSQFSKLHCSVKWNAEVKVLVMVVHCCAFCLLTHVWHTILYQTKLIRLLQNLREWCMLPFSKWHWQAWGQWHTFVCHCDIYVALTWLVSWLLLMCWPVFYCHYNIYFRRTCCRILLLLTFSQ